MATEQDGDVHAAIIELLEPGSKKKGQIIDELGDEFGESEIKFALSDLLTSGEIEEHPGIENHWRIVDGD